MGAVKRNVNVKESNENTIIDINISNKGDNYLYIEQNTLYIVPQLSA